MASKPVKLKGDHAAGRQSDHLIKRNNHKPPSKTKRTPRERSSNLPVNQYKETFFKLINDNKALVIVGETGSGKTTQIPQWCLEFCNNQTKKLAVACTQPRRIAAMSVSARVAQEMQVTLGQEVGYSVRFEACSSPKTKLKYLTDGMLLREAMLDAMLKSYGVIIIDEVHERTLQTEILLGIVKRALASRVADTETPPLKVIVMSATIDCDLFKKFLDAPILSIAGRQHTVQDMFAEVPQSDLLTSTLITVFQIHRTSDDGDILVFCSGQDEIQSLITMCKKVLKQAPESLQSLTPLPLYASLPAGHQMRVFDIDKTPVKTNGVSVPPSSSAQQSSAPRRVIFATNVAETSVTIPNIKFVIDTGKVKCRTYCPKTGLESLKVSSISKAQASQRSGRAGRIATGTCYRLYTSEEYATMCDHLLPEIKRCNLEGVVLQMVSIGINDIASFEFLERPDEARVKGAISNLLTLKAIKVSASPKHRGENQIAEPTTASSSSSSSPKAKKAGKITNMDNLLNLNYELTNLGKKLSTFPLDPSMSRIILAANELHCLDEALTIVSLLYTENLFHIPPNKQSQADSMLEKFRSNEGDTIMLLKVFKAFKRVYLLNRSGLKQWCADHFIHTKNLRLSRLVRKQLMDLCKSLGMNPSSCGSDTSIVRRALTYGLFNNVATMWNGKYRNRSSSDICIHPNSCLFRTKPDCVLYVEIVETNKCYMKNCTLIDMNWIREMSSANMMNSNSSTNSKMKTS